MSAAPPAPLAVHLLGIHKRFGPVHANRDVNLAVRAGTVHGIVGENGAGKSTLMAILYGFYEADEGEIEIEGHPARIRSSREAIALGVGMVHQHFMLVDDFTALDNVLLGAEPHWRLGAARAALRTQLQGLMRDTGLQVRLDEKVEDLPVGERQRLEILKALVRGARILILDEPTAVLTPQETDTLFETLKRLRAQGTTVLLITHKLREIMALCDHVTVMRAGQVVHDCAIDAIDIDGLAEAMVGRRVQLGAHAAAPSATASGEAVATVASAPLLDARQLRWCDDLGVPRLDGIDLRLAPGEIVGVAGVAGNGQTELLDVLSGLLAPQEGRLSVASQSFEPAAWLDPAQARALGVAHVPEDRHKRAMVLPFPAWETAAFGYQDDPRYGTEAWMDQSSMRADCAALMEDWDVRPRQPLLKSANFSGGNQQKLVLGREALRRPRVLLVGQPTRGVDIGAIEFIHQRLRALRDEGCAVLLVSSELDEILALADRVVVMAGGRITGELPRSQCSEAALGRLMGGEAKREPPPEPQGGRPR